ncbi:MAG: sortase [Clostridia bacterium]|nr:sortase [Clostridia bacterium]
MKEKKFNKVLTVLLILVAISIVIIIGFYGYDVINRVMIKSNADHMIDEFNNHVDEVNVGPNEPDEEESNSDDSDSESESESGNKSSRNRNSDDEDYYEINYDGYNIVGKIKIPKTGIEYPILDEASVSSMQLSVGIIYGPGLNRIGNTVIMGHNYRNGTFFSDNDKLSNGDVIYITNSSGRRRRYIVYNKYVTDPSDFDYAVRDTAGKREITLSSCTDDSQNRIIIWAREA